MKAAFGRCEFDAARLELRHDGEVVEVQPQVFAVLEYLIRHRDRVVPKEELLDEVWGDRFVGDATLASRIKFARRAVGDDGRQQAIIRTFHGRGYRFVAELKGAEAAVSAPTDETIAADAEEVTGSSEPGDASGAAPAPSRSDVDRWPMIGRSKSMEAALAAFADLTVGGVVITGPDRVGKTRLAAEVIERCQAAGHRIERLTASAPASTIPLAVLAPLLPGNVVHVEDAGSIAPAIMLRRAQAAIEEQAPADGRLVIMIDDAQHLDDVSESLLATLMVSNAAFVVAAQRLNPQHRGAFDELVRGGTVREIELPPLDDTEVDTLLYRVLKGPIEPITLTRLGEITGGKPGLLREIVDASLDDDALAQEQGVWRLVGPVRSAHSTEWPVEGLTPAAVRAAEMFGLIRDLPLDDATDLMTAEALDELDHAGLLALAMDDMEPIVSLADPVLAERLPGLIPPVRRRRHLIELNATLLSHEPRPSNLATVASWADELGQPIDGGTALLAARRALMSGEDEAAEALASYLRGIGEAHNPYVAVIEAEICFRRAQLARAEALLDEVDTSQLDDFTAGYVLRRIATIQTQLHGTYAESVDWLVEQESGAKQRIRESLAAQRLTTMVLLGRVDELTEAAGPLLEKVSGVTAVEVLLSRARAHVMAGRIDDALIDLDDQDRLMAELTLTGPEADLPREAAAAIRLSCAIPRGEIDAGLEMIRSWSVAGKRTMRTWLPLMAAEVQMEVGRPRLARELIRPGMEINRRRGFEHGRLLSEARFALTSAELGDLSQAGQMFDGLLADMYNTGPGNIWNLIETLVEIGMRLGRAHECTDRALALADDACEHGAHLAEANVRFAIATADPKPELAQATAERIAATADRVGGRYWPIKMRHLRAIANGEPLDDVIATYQSNGFVGSATRAALTGRL